MHAIRNGGAGERVTAHGSPQPREPSAEAYSAPDPIAAVVTELVHTFTKFTA